MAKLFGLFSKIRDKRVENPLGVGLGLAICKQLVELMRGQIHVTSVYAQAGGDGVFPLPAHPPMATTGQHSAWVTSPHPAGPACQRGRLASS